MIQFLNEIGDLYQRHIVDVGRQAHLVVFVSFLLTFAAVRFITYSIRAGRFRIFHNVSAGGTHIHHLVWGILLLMATGYVAIAYDPTSNREALALLFGAGAALTMDEFALWLNLTDVYWTQKGRESIDAVIITAAVLAIFTVGAQFWISAAEESLRLIGLPI
jgi:hypothetical protein